MCALAQHDVTTYSTNIIRGDPRDVHVQEGSGFPQAEEEEEEGEEAAEDKEEE